MNQDFDNVGVGFHNPLFDFAADIVTVLDREITGNADSDVYRYIVSVFAGTDAAFKSGSICEMTSASEIGDEYNLRGDFRNGSPAMRRFIMIVGMPP